MVGADDFEQRPNVRWDNDFGPDTPMWARYVMAGCCIAAVLGFLGAAIFLMGDTPGGDGGKPIDFGNVAAFVGGVILIVVIALRGERWAIRTRQFFERRPDNRSHR